MFSELEDANRRRSGLGQEQSLLLLSRQRPVHCESVLIGVISYWGLRVWDLVARANIDCESASAAPPGCIHAPWVAPTLRPAIGVISSTPILGTQGEPRHLASALSDPARRESEDRSASKTGQVWTVLSQVWQSEFRW